MEGWTLWGHSRCGGEESESELTCPCGPVQPPAADVDVQEHSQAVLRDRVGCCGASSQGSTASTDK